MSPSALEGHDSNQAHSILGEVVDLLHNPYGGFLEGLCTAGYQRSNLADEQDPYASCVLPMNTLSYVESLFLSTESHASPSFTYTTPCRVPGTSTPSRIATPSDTPLLVDHPLPGPSHTLHSERSVMAPADVEQEFSEDHGEDFLPETQPMAGPSRLSAAPSRLQPQRAAKRKRTERENAPVAESSVRRTKRQRRAGPVQPSGLPTPALPDPSPPLRTRRTKAELERAVMPSASTRCGLGGCNHKLYGDQDEVRAHVRFHYPHAPKPGKGSKEATKAGTKTKGKSKAPPPSSGSDDSEDSDDAESDASEDTSGISNAKNPVVCTYEAKGRPGQQCGEGYNSVLSLSRHLEHEHYGWKFPCPKCQTLLARRDALRRHLKKCQGPKTRKPPARR